MLPISRKALSEPVSCGLALILAFAAGSRKVSLVRSPRYSENCSISLGFFITIFTLIAFGPRICIWTAFASAFGSCLLPRRLPWEQFVFNVASITTTACLSAIVYTALQNGPFAWSHMPLLVTLVATGVYFLLNSGLVSAVIAITSSRSIWGVWSGFLWTGPSYFAGASIAMLVQLWAGANVNLLIMVPILAFIQQSYQTHMDRLDESRRHLKQREHDIEELEKSRKLLSDLYTSTVNCLAAAIDAKDECTHAHIHRVQKLAVGIAETMNVSGDELEAIRTGALLHDVGKLAVPDHILGKLGPLTEEEFLQMKLHTVVGAEMLEPVRFPWPVAAVVRHHHERWDGNGYPDALAGEDIPLPARIMAVADVYDALTSDRPYRAAWSHARARRYIVDAVGAQFDPAVVDAFLVYIDSDVALRANSLAAFRPMNLQRLSIVPTTAVVVRSEKSRDRLAGMAPSA